MNAVFKPVDLFEAAAIVAQEYPVFPCRPQAEGKYPAKSPRTEHGFRDASLDAMQIYTWWAQHPDSLVGVPTGIASGFVVIDDDTAKNPDAASSIWLDGNRALLEGTRRHTTTSGGTHYVFLRPEGAKITTRKGITVNGQKLKSIDTRGEGGYIIYWPAHGYASGGDIQPLPQALIDQLCERREPAASTALAVPAKSALPDWVWNSKAFDLPLVLAYLNPADRDVWWKTGMALKHAGGDAAFPLWHQWSAGEFTPHIVLVNDKGESNYLGEADCRKTWASFGKDPTRTPVTLNSVYADARKAGWIESRPALVAPPPPNLVAPPPSVPAGTLLAPPAPGADPYISRVDRTDAGNANLLVQLANGNLRYVAETKQWLRWDGKRWQIDEHEVFVTTFALEVAKHYLDESKRLSVLAKEPGRGDAQVAGEDAAKWAAKCRNKASIDNMITLARKSEGVPISVVELDRKPYLLGVENGVVDLLTGELHEAEAREDYVTKRCPVRYNPTATAPRWEALIAQATGSPIPAERDASGAVIPGTVGRFTPRPALAHYMHKALGYGATGETREQKFFFGIGEGSNGKGLIFDTVKSVLGPYAAALPSDALMASKHGTDAERPTALAATLAGARFVIASESKEGQKLDVATIKAHTGDSEMTARRMRENPFTFAITHKIWLLSNVRPAIDHLDAAMRGRLHLIPFDRRWNRPGEFERDPTLPDGDKSLMAQLAAEAEGVLASIVRGAVLYVREGLTPPAEVVEKTREYVMEQDHLGRWLATMQRCPPKQGTPAAELFGRFMQWCQADGSAVEPSNMTGFGRALRSRSVESVRVPQGIQWGLRLALAPPPPGN